MSPNCSSMAQNPKNSPRSNNFHRKIRRKNHISMWNFFKISHFTFHISPSPFFEISSISPSPILGFSPPRGVEVRRGNSSMNQTPSQREIKISIWCFGFDSDVSIVRSDRNDWCWQCCNIWRDQCSTDHLNFDVTFWTTRDLWQGKFDHHGKILKQIDDWNIFLTTFLLEIFEGIENTVRQCNV